MNKAKNAVTYGNGNGDSWSIVAGNSDTWRLGCKFGGTSSQAVSTTCTGSSISLGAAADSYRKYVTFTAGTRTQSCYIYQWCKAGDHWTVSDTDSWKTRIT